MSLVLWFTHQSCLGRPLATRLAQAALRGKTWKETIFKIIAGRINIYTIMVVSYMGSSLQSANCNVLSILNCVLIREVFFNFQCIYFCCKKIIHNFLFAKNIQLIWNLFQSAIWGWWRWWVWEISLEANQFIKRMDHNWWLSLGLYQTWFHPGIFLCLW